MRGKDVLLGAFILLTVVFAVLSVYEYDQAGNLRAQMPSTTQTTQCVRTGEGWALYVRVVEAGDSTPISGTPASGVKINAIPYVTCASGNTDWGSPITKTTPDNGTVALPTGGIDGYSIVAVDQGTQYPVGVIYLAPVQVTTVVLSVPSGNVTVMHSVPP